jgi:hypothetical protein
MIKELRELIPSICMLAGPDTAKWAMDWTGKYETKPKTIEETFP